MTPIWKIRMYVFTVLLASLLSALAVVDANGEMITVTPGQSINAAIGAAAVGDTVLVKPGTYAAFRVTKALFVIGEPGANIVGANGVGFGIEVAANGVTVEGFRIENFAIAIGSQAKRSAVKVLRNHTYKNDYSLWANGDGWLIEGNEFERAYWWAKTGDSDYTRMFGRNHVFRRNWIHGAVIPTDFAPATGNDYAHLDGIQYFGNSGDNDLFQNILIEDCIFEDFVQAIYISNPASTGAIDNVIIRNCVIVSKGYPDSGGQLGTRAPWGCLFGSGNGAFPAKRVQFINNLVYGPTSAFAMTGGGQGLIEKNIIVNAQAAYYTEGASTAGFTGAGDWMFNVQTLGGWNHPAAVTANPQFVNILNVVGPDGIPFTADDGWRSAATQAGYGPNISATGTPTPIPPEPEPEPEPVPPSEHTHADLQAAVDALKAENAAQQATINALDAFMKKYPIEVRVKDNRSGQTGQRWVPGRMP